MFYFVCKFTIVLQSVEILLNMIQVWIAEPLHELLRESLSRQGFCVYSGLEIPENIQQIQVLVLRSKKISAELIDQMPVLKLIARAGSGTENIDVAYAKAKGIQVVNSPEANCVAVAEHTLGMLLALLNHIPSSNTEVKQGLWKRNANWGTTLQGKNVGIVGYGHTGTAFANVLSGLGVNILAFDKYKKGFATDRVKEVSLKEVFLYSDILSLHIPQTQDTLMFCDQNFYDSFAKPIYLINTSRGKIVPSKALYQALEHGKVLGACLDVLEAEESHFEGAFLSEEWTQKLAQHPRVIITPHIAGWTYESYQKHAEILLEKINQFFNLNP